IKANPALYLDEMEEQLFAAWDVLVSLARLSQTLRQLNITHKQVAQEALERNELLHATWQGAYRDIPMQYMVWLDESSIDDCTNQWKEG
ncbi:hypothetical protein DICSQDRAFT_16180, partial [Dichomitus squalens LYAD-421 SS1]